MPALTQELVRSLFDYEPETGRVFWTTRKRGVRKSKLAGHKRRDGRIVICIQGKHYYAHTLIWLWMTGELPLQLDHKDCNPSNNKWNNLREANYSENMRNRYVRADNGVGFKGVRRLGNKYQARLTCDGKVHVKYGFDCPEEAHKAYCKMAETYHESFRRY